MNSFEAAQKKIVAFRNERDWDQFHNPKDMALSLVLEASELIEHFQWRNQQEIETYLSKNKEKVSDELADVLYWVLLIAHDLDIDIEDALSSKMQKNEIKYPVEKSKGKHTKYTEL